MVAVVVVILDNVNTGAAGIVSIDIDGEATDDPAKLYPDA